MDYKIRISDYTEEKIYSIADYQFEKFGNNHFIKLFYDELTYIKTLLKRQSKDVQSLRL